LNNGHRHRLSNTGSGKQTAVRLAAEGLGMHVVEFNCYDFVGTSEGKTAAALMNSFKSAERLVEFKNYALTSRLKSGWVVCFQFKTSFKNPGYILFWSLILPFLGYIAWKKTV
jgi:hypothetical protein